MNSHTLREKLSYTKPVKVSDSVSPLPCTRGGVCEWVRETNFPEVIRPLTLAAQKVRFRGPGSNQGNSGMARDPGGFVVGTSYPYWVTVEMFPLETG